MTAQKERLRRLRWEILNLVYRNHHDQKPRLTDSIIFGVLERLHYDASLNEVRTLLQDMKGRGWLSYASEKDLDTGRTRIFKIEITPEGRDQVEDSDARDPALSKG